MKTKKNPTPMSEAGRSMHAGQMSVSAPRKPAIELARLTPTGQLPCLFCQKTSPALSDRSITSSAMYMISACDAGVRGGDRSTPLKYPSSHAKNDTVIMNVMTNGSQKARERSVCFIDYSIAFSNE